MTRHPRSMSDKVSGYQKFFQEARKNKISAMTPEQQVLRHLAEQSNRKKKQKRSRRRPPPFFAVILLAVSLCAGAIGILSPNAFDSAESFEQILSKFNLPFGVSLIPKIKLGMFGIAFAADDKSKEKPTPKRDAKAEAKHDAKTDAAKPDAAKKSAGAAETAGDKQPAETASANPDLKSWTTEEVSFFKRLNDRKIELDRREAELAKLEEELQKQRAGIEDKIKALEKTRAEISATLKGRVEQDLEKVAKLVDVYSSMKPTSAAKVIESLNEDLAMSILDKMKKKSAAEILNTMSAPKAKRLSEMLTGYRKPASASKEE